MILSGLKEDTMSELDRQMLSNRAMIYANRKIRKLDDESKKELMNIVTITKKELPSVTINGTIVSFKEKYSRKLFILIKPVKVNKKHFMNFII